MPIGAADIHPSCSIEQFGLKADMRRRSKGFNATDALS
jgi:hypothetical protein